MYYCKAKKTLDRYKHMSTFKDIEEECTAIIHKVKNNLYEEIEMLNTNQSIVTENILLLNQLGEPIETLSKKIIERIEKSLEYDLEVIKNQIDSVSDTFKNAEFTTENSFKYRIPMDILEFVDYGCNGFMTNLSSSIQLFNNIFLCDQKIKM
jgi:hypothetical protein